MELGIRGKVAVVTACSAGLGRAAAEALAAEGVNLVMFARTEEKLKASAQEIATRFQVRTVPVAGDMSQAADVQRLVATVRETFGGADILVLNTGRPPLAMREVLDENDEARWSNAYDTQLRGAVLVAQSVVPLLVERGWGRVIAITSASVKQPMTRHGLSTVFRAGVTAFMKHLANEIAPRGVTVNTVCPASIATPSLVKSYDVTERARQVPLKRMGKPEELGATVAFLASEHAGYITGASLHVDGGMVAALY